MRIFDGMSYQLLKIIRLGSDVHNVRSDPEHKEIYVGYGSGALAMVRQLLSKKADRAIMASQSFYLNPMGESLRKKLSAPR